MYFTKVPAGQYIPSFYRDMDFTTPTSLVYAIESYFTGSEDRDFLITVIGLYIENKGFESSDVLESLMELPNIYYLQDYYPDAPDSWAR
jgi:hypothetical protein